MLPFDIDEYPSASWIWSSNNPDAEGQIGQFRLVFETVGPACWVGFADTAYTLFVNGEVVGVGPATGIYTRPRLTVWDFGSKLRKGTNVIALEVWFQGRRPDCADTDTFQAGLIGWLHTSERIIPTGREWKARHASGYTMPGPETKRLFASRRLIIADLREEPLNWTKPGFDDSPWPAAEVVAPHPNAERPDLRPTPLPSLTVTPIQPTTLIDAGTATGDRPVALAEDVARRMAGQERKSLVRKPSSLPEVFSRRGDTVWGLPDPELIAALGWPSQNEGPTWPIAIRPVDGDFFLTYDMGVQTSGCVRLQIETTTETVVDIAYGDHLEDGYVDPREMDHSLADRVITAPGRHSIRLPHDRGFRYVQLSFSGPSVLHEFSVEEHVYPHDRIERFHCSDPTLNAIWKAAARTAHQCSLYSHVDNSRRERQGWGGPDLFASSRGFFHLFGDTRLTRKHLEDFCDFFDVHGSIPNFFPATDPWVGRIVAHDLWFPASCWQYLLLSDDRAFAPRLLAASEAVLTAYDHRNECGILGGFEGWRWAEWNFMAAEETCMWENLLTIQAWRCIAKMRRFLELPDDEGAEGAAESLARAVVKIVWHPQHGALSQGTRADGSLLDFCGQAENVLALLLDVLPAEKRKSALQFCGGVSGTWPTNRSGWQGGRLGERIRHDPRKPVVAGSPFVSDLCARAMLNHDSPEKGVNYIRHHFGAMLDEGEGTLWESWISGAEMGVSATCQSQGWGTSIAATLVTKILGLKIVAPGGRQVLWRPQECGLAWIKGSIETAYGPVTVHQEGVRRRYCIPEGVILIVEDGPRRLELRGPSDGECNEWNRTWR